jgi:RNA polymerase sigma-70 factor, ECF subfamily
MIDRPELGAPLADIEHIYRTRLGALRRVATAITGDPESGYEAVQDAFARAVHLRSQFRGDSPSLEGWVWRIVVNAAYDVVRRSARHRTQLSGGEAELNGLATASPRDDDHDELRALIAGLPERQRVALFLRYYADLDYTSIAVVLGIRPGTVGATLQHAKQNLRQLMIEVKA